MSSDSSQRKLEFRSTAAVQAFGPFALDVANARLLRDGVPVALTPKALEALALLLASPGQLVSRETFASALWPDTIVEDGNLSSTIWMVRRALGEHGGWIQTVPKRGYRFVGQLAGPLTATTRGAAPPQPAPWAESGPPARDAPWQRRRAIGIGLAFAVLLLAVLGLRSRTGPAGPIRAVAVLPFRSVSAVADQAYFADGMTDAVITDLASIGGLRVVPHQSVRRYAASTQPVGEIARELGVEAIVEGALTRLGPRLRLTTRLVDARSNRHIWAVTYERDIDDVLTLQAEVARAVAEALQVGLSEPEHRALAVRPAVNPDAYDHYLRGRYFFAQRSEPSLARSREHFRRAIDRDATFAPAWAGLALAYGPSGYFGYVPPAEGSSQQRAAARRALELDPTLVDAEVALANVLTLYDYDWEGAERAYRKILERHPDHAQARLWYGMMLGHRGRLEDALAERQRALSLDPLSLRFNTSVADTLTAMHRFEEAIGRYQKTLELEPGFAPARLGLGVALLGSGRKNEAVLAIEEADRRSSDVRSRATLGHAYGLVGRVADARAILDELQTRARQAYISPAYLAFVHAGLGDRDAAFAAINAALDDRSPLMASVNADPLFDPVRDDPRFAGVLRRLRLPVPGPPQRLSAHKGATPFEPR